MIRLAVVALALFASTGAQAAIWSNSDSMVVRNSSGQVVTVRFPTPTASVATSGGAAAARASQLLTVGNSSALLTLSKAITPAALASGAVVAARVIGPIALAGLAYEGIRWAADEWLYDAPGDPNAAYWWTHDPMHASYATCLTFASQCTFETNTVEAANAYCAQNASTRHSCYVADPTLTLVHAPSNKYKFSIGYTVTSTGAPGVYTNAFVYRQANGVTPDPSSSPATDAQMQLAIEAALSANPAQAGAVLDASANAGSFTFQSQTTTGPTTIQGPTSTSSTVNASGTTTVNTSTVYNLTYEGNTVTVTATTTTTTTNPDNSQTVTTTTTEPADEPAEEPPASAVDQELGEIPVLYERKYPDGLVGVWNAKRAAFDQTSFAQAIGALTPDLGDGGCPAPWTVALDFGAAGSYSGDLSVPCWIWSALRVLIIVSALFMARRLIFGG